MHDREGGFSRSNGCLARSNDRLHALGRAIDRGRGWADTVEEWICTFEERGDALEKWILLVSLTVEALLKGFSQYVQAALPGGLAIAVSVYLIFDFAVVTSLFAMIFKFLPDAKIQWRDVWFGAAMTALFFGIGKRALGVYLGSGAASSAYGAASSLITLLLWIYYSSQILLLGAEFTQVYANQAGRRVKPNEHAVPIVETRVERPRGAKR